MSTLRTAPLRVGVLGAGAIGAYLGGRLAAGGHDVLLVGRAPLLAPIAARGVVLEDVRGAPRTARPRVADDPAALEDREVVLVTTKALDLERAARSIAGHRSLAIGLQNGVDHPRVLRSILGEERARAGTVGFNVVWRDERTLRRSTTGPLAIERRRDDPAVDRVLAALRGAGLDARGADPIEPVLWTKLLFNLNNPINALSELPLRDQLSSRAWRRVLSACQREALAAMSAAGIRPVRVGLLDARISWRALLLPDALFRVAARSMIRIDPAARSSMSEDVARGRKTEIDLLNGAVVRLGAAHGVPTPVNARVVAAMHAVEEGRSAPGADALLAG